MCIQKFTASVFLISKWYRHMFITCILRHVIERDLIQPPKDTKHLQYLDTFLQYCNRRLTSSSQPHLQSEILSQNINDRMTGQGHACPSFLQHGSTWKTLGKQTDHKREETISQSTFYCCDKHCSQRNLGRTGFICLTCPNHSIIGGSQGRSSSRSRDGNQESASCFHILLSPRTTLQR